MREALSKYGYESGTRSRSLRPEDIEWADVVFYMDSGNLRRLMADSCFAKHSSKFMSLASLLGCDKIPDPHFTKDQHEPVLSLIERSVTLI
jgi:protein-tyrosine-phosphatase